LDNHLLDYVAISPYFAVMIGAGYLGLRGARSADDYLVAGRRLGPFMYIGTLSALAETAARVFLPDLSISEE
jgi:Na+/proline symporter